MFCRGSQFFISNPDTGLSQTVHYLNQNHNHKALCLLDQMLKTRGVQISLLYIKAIALARLKKTSAALDALTELLNIDPGHNDALQLFNILKHIPFPKCLNLRNHSEWDPVWHYWDPSDLNKLCHGLNHSYKFPFESCSFDIIYTNNPLAIIEKEYVSDFFDECFRILRVRGLLRIVVSNKVLYDYPNSQNEPLSTQNIKQALAKTGFKIIRECCANESLIPDFETYCYDIDENGNERTPGSIYLEANRFSLPEIF